MKIRLALLSCALAVAAFAADVTGKWNAEVQGRNGPRQVTIDLKADGDKLTGTFGGGQMQAEITNGKVEGNNVSFDVVREFNGNKMTMHYTGTLSGDEIKFKQTVEGRDRTTEFTAKRASTT